MPFISYTHQQICLLLHRRHLITTASLSFCYHLYIPCNLFAFIFHGHVIVTATNFTPQKPTVPLTAPAHAFCCLARNPFRLSRLQILKQGWSRPVAYLWQGLVDVHGSAIVLDQRCPSGQREDSKERDSCVWNPQGQAAGNLSGEELGGGPVNHGARDCQQRCSTEAHLPTHPLITYH